VRRAILDRVAAPSYCSTFRNAQNRMSTHTALPALTDAARRPVLRTRALYAVLGGTAAALLLFFIVRPSLPAAWSVPGSPELYVAGLLGALLALTPFAFSLAKRSGAAESPPAWFVAHVIAACIGMALLIVHSGGYIRRPPALVLAGGLFLVAQGAWSRAWLSHKISGVFGGKYRAIVSAGTVDKEKLRGVIDCKRTLLARLDPAADEALFSPTLSHWLRRPLASWKYSRLARAEMALIGQRAAVSPLIAYWRTLHIGVALLFLLGLIVHIVTVTFFAGYVADGGPIHWWHLAAWGGP